MTLAAERMKALCRLRLIVPDARSQVVRRRVAKEVAALNRSRERDALGWIEAVSDFDSGARCEP
jgi:hypothetical protein